MLYIFDAIEKDTLHQQMVQYSMASSRSDGTPNRVVMNGKSGAVGYSYVRLQYLEDGWIRLTGKNLTDNDAWKLISVFNLEPGKYTLTGMKGQAEKTVALQLCLKDDQGYNRYIFQYDEDVQVVVRRDSNATLHARVYPWVESINLKAQPAVYRDE